MSQMTTTLFGFIWGPVRVTRISSFPRGHVVDVNGVEIYVSAKGRSVRVFRDGKELK